LFFLILTGIFNTLTFLNQRKSTRFLDLINKLDKDDIKEIIVSVKTSQHCKRGNYTIDGNRFESFSSKMKKYELISNQSSRLLPVEIYEVKLVFMNNDEPLCFLVFNSKAYAGGVVRFSSDCKGMPKIVDVRNQMILNFIHESCFK
jgi:hypothetical protein